MNSPLVECVPNFSEGRNPATIHALEEAIASAPGSSILHSTSDPDHNRTVITFAGPGASVIESSVRAARVCLERIDLNQFRGIHPRLGALDVLPFVPLSGTTLADCVGFAGIAGQRIWKEVGIPVFFYEAAALRPERKRLENVRRGEFEGIRDALKTGTVPLPDVGGPLLHPTAGAVIAGARPFLIAYNINLRTSNLAAAKAIAKDIRASSGGLPAVKALGVPLASRGLVQVSMNLTDFRITPLPVVFAEVARSAMSYGVEIEESELIGLIPGEAIEHVDLRSLKLKNFGPELIIENRLKAIANSHSATHPGSISVL